MNASVHIQPEPGEKLSTAILSETYRISSELRSQATAGLVSTTVGDHVGIRGAVGSLFLGGNWVTPIVHHFFQEKTGVLVLDLVDLVVR